MRGVVFYLVLLSALTVRAQWMTQNLPLVQGWNAVYLQVQPVDDACGDVFDGHPILSVNWWCRDASIDGDGSPPGPQMRAWYPSAPAASTFFRMLGGECYLIETAAATTLTLKGVPALPESLLWLNEPNLVAMHVPLPNNVMLSEYFEFFDNLAATLPFKRVPSDETPVTVLGSYQPSPGQALWVETQGAGRADYAGPLNVWLDSPVGVMAFSGVLSPRTLSIRNNASVERTVRIERIASETPPPGQGDLAGNVPLMRSTIDWSAGYPRENYLPFELPWSTNLAAHATLELKLLPQLTQMPPTAADYQSILVISDQGSADNDPALTQGRCRYYVGVRAAGDLAELSQPTGLWVGNVTLTGVNRAETLSETALPWDPEVTQPAPHPFSFRVILHVDEYGQTRLLKEIFMASAAQGAANPGNTLLPSRATALAFRAQNPSAVIRRISSANFPFMPPLTLAGPGFAVADAELTGAFTLGFDDRVNPFAHAFHADHDNVTFLNSVLTPIGDGASGTGEYESWSVGRTIGLTFAAEDPLGPNTRWNIAETGGTYRESMTGLHQSEIKTEGVFRLSKVSDVATIWTVSGPP